MASQAEDVAAPNHEAVKGKVDCDDSAIEVGFLASKQFAPMFTVGLLGFALACAFLTRARFSEAIAVSLLGVIWIVNGVVFMRKRKSPYVKVENGVVNILRTEFIALAVFKDWVFALDQIERIEEKDKFLLIVLKERKPVKVHWGLMPIEERGPLLRFFRQVVDVEE